MGTLGRQIVEGASQVPDPRADAPRQGARRADRRVFRRTRTGTSCLAGVLLKRAPRRAFITHGEPQVAEHFGATLRQKMGWSALFRRPGQSVELDYQYVNSLSPMNSRRIDVD